MTYADVFGLIAWVVLCFAIGWLYGMVVNLRIALNAQRYAHESLHALVWSHERKIRALQHRTGDSNE